MLFRLIITATLLVVAWYIFNGLIFAAKMALASTFSWMFP